MSESEGGKTAVSVVIPTYNRSAVLAEALPTYLGSHEVGELLVVSDGSTDDTCECVGRLAGEDPRIRLIELGSHRGTPAARNAGVLAAKYPRIFMGEDDVFAGDRAIDLLATTWEALRDSGVRVGIVAPRLERFEGYGRFDGGRQRYAWMSRITSELYFKFDLHVERPIPVEFTHACNLSTKAILIEAGLFRPKAFLHNSWREETDLQFRVRRRGYGIFYDPVPSLEHIAVSCGGTHHRNSAIECVKDDYFKITNHWRFLSSNLGAGRLFQMYGYGVLTLWRRFLVTMTGRPTLCLH